MTLLGAGNQGSVGGGGGGSATFNPADKSANISLPSPYLTPTSSAANSNVRSITSHATGKYGFTWSAGVTTHKVGICLATDSLTADIASQPGAYVLYGPGGQVYHNGSASGMPPADTAGLGVAGTWVLDFTNHLAWFFSPANGTWNSDPTADPVTGVGGFTIASGTYFAVFGGDASDTVTCNFATPTLPSGFSAWG